MENKNENIKYCPLINGDCLKEKCSMALAEEHAGKIDCSIKLITREMTRLKVAQRMLTEQLEELDKKSDLRDERLEYIVMELRKER